MSDLPKRVTIDEEGPREGFQSEKKPIPVSEKVRLIEALAETGLALALEDRGDRVLGDPGSVDDGAVDVEVGNPEPGRESLSERALPDAG